VKEQCCGPSEPGNLSDLFEESAAKFAERPLFGEKNDGEWRWLTYADVKARVDGMRRDLSVLGVGRGDRVAIIANNSVEWAVAAYAVFGLGAVYVPMYESQNEKDWGFILKDCGAKVLLAANGDIAGRVGAISDGLPSLAHVIVLGGSAASRAGAPAPCRPEPEETACIIYTSGTTGDPKGVVLTHDNIASNIAGVHRLGIITEEDRSLSFLPWAHAMGHTCELHGLVRMGASIAICESVEKIVSNLAEVRPTILFAVPRIFNKIYNGVRKQMEAKPGFIQWLFEGGLSAAKKRNRGSALAVTESMKLTLADRIIFAKVRKKFGGRLRLAISGAAALATEVAEFIDALGIEVYEGYGLSETSPIVSVNYPGNRKLGSVGKPIPGVLVSIAASAEDPEQGEIIVHGPNVMQGYYKRPEETAAVFTPDGGFRTGDLGKLDADGYLTITGRIKEQYKLENGKYVVPGPLEEALKLSPLVANVMIHGANRPYNVALIVADMDALKARMFGSQPVIPGYAPETLLADTRVHDLYAAEIARLAADWKGYEGVKRFTLIAEDFTQENGMLTPTMKLKRRNVLAKWGSEIDKLYA